MAAHQIDQAAGNEERRDAARPLLVQNDRRLGYAMQAADARADHHAGFDLLLVGLGRPVGVLQRLSRRRDAVEDESIDPSLFLRLHPIVGIEGVRSLAARNLGGDLTSDVGYVEVFDPRRPPIWPANSLRQVGSTPQANGETMPRPVTTTRFISRPRG